MKFAGTGSKLIALASLVLLGACREGDLGPVAVRLRAQSRFEIQSSRTSKISMDRAGESPLSSFYYDHSRRYLYVSIGSQKVVFRGAQFNVNAGHLISSPAVSKVVDGRGLRVGVQITRHYLGGNSHVTYWDYRAQIFNERNQIFATGSARIEEAHPLSR